MSKKILVTGSAGFIGSHLVESLLNDGFEVVGVDNFDPFYDPRIKKINIEGFIKNQRFCLETVDIRNSVKLSKVFGKHHFSHCIHLAARAGVRPSIQDPALYHDVNIQGTLNLLNLCRDFEVENFIFGSSSSVYGKRNRVPFSEVDALLSPVSPYAATKIAGEALCHVYHDLYGIRMSCLRFFTVYGPRQRPEMAIHKFIRAIDRGKVLTLFGDGRSSRDYTFFSDIIQGIRACLNGRWSYEIFNLGDSKAISLIQLVRLIEKRLAKKAKIRWMSDQPGDVPKTFADISKARKTLGYNPQVEIGQGIDLFCHWFRENG